MTLILLDPNLRDPHGHHMEWNFAIAAEARARGDKTLIFAHRDCQLRGGDDLEIVPVFSCTTYERRYHDPITGPFDDFTFLNDRLAEELASLPRERLQARDLVLAPTLSENHLLGYVSWMRSFEPASAPLFALYLMFPSGVELSEGREPQVGDPFQALFYKLALRRAAEPGAPIHMFASGRQLAREFSELAGAPIEPHPIPIEAAARDPRRDGGPPTALLFVGDAKLDKGFAGVPNLADRLCGEFPGWRFVVHANPGAANGPALKALNRLSEEIAPRRPNLRVHAERLPRPAYLKLIAEADGFVSTYDPAVYARKSSGVVWEAIALGLPLLVPAQTWLEREAREWGAGCVAYDGPDALSASFAQFARELPDLTARSGAAAASFALHNGVGALMDQLGRLWTPRRLAAELAPQPQSPPPLALLDIEKQGWALAETHDGQTVRWVGKTFEIEFSWPFDVAWRAEVAWRADAAAARFFGAGQPTAANAFEGGEALEVSAQVNDDRISGVVTVTGRGDRSRPLHNVRIELPWACWSAGEKRDLGLLAQSVRISPGRPLAKPTPFLLERAASGGDAMVWIDGFRVTQAQAQARVEAASGGEPDDEVVGFVAATKAPGAATGARPALFTAHDIPDDASGFYGVETMNNGSAIRWTGPLRESRFVLEIDRSSPVAVTVRFASLGRNRPDQVSLRIDGQNYPLGDSPQEGAFGVGPAPRAFGRVETEFVLRVESMMRPWETGSADGRELGVAIEWLSVEAWTGAQP